MNTHEDFTRTVSVHGSSDRAFGLLFAAVFAGLGFARTMVEGMSPHWGALGLAAAFLLAALTRPSVLHPMNAGWFRFGLQIGKVTTPFVTALLFFLVVTPTALLMRLFRRDPLHLGRDPHVETYWLPRRPPGPPPHTMINQF